VFSGVVRDEQGRAVAGALVTTLLWDVGRFYETSTDDAGRFLLGPLPPGVYGSGLFISKAGLLTASLSPSVAGKGWHEVLLFAPRGLSGRVVDAQGPVSGVTVQAESGGHVASATTDARGAFRLEGLCPRKDYLLTSGDEARYAQRVVRPGPGLEVEAGELVLGDRLRLSGRVTDTSGRPIEGADVRLLGGVEQKTLLARTDAQGGFLFEPLVPGRYGLELQAEHYLNGQMPTRLISASEEQHFTLQEAVRVEGHTVDERGAPVAGVTLNLVRAADDPPLRGSSTRSGEDGAFVLDVPKPGSRYVLASHPDFLAEQFLFSVPVRDARLTLRAGASLEARLEDGEGRPVKQAGFLLKAKGGGKGGAPDAEGRVVFRGLVPGSYTLEAWPLGEEGRSVSRDVEVRDAESQEEVSLELEEAWSLSGEVVDPHGKPIEGVSLLASRELALAKSQVVPGRGGRGLRQGVSGPDGRFTLAHLAEEPWVLRVDTRGYSLDAEASKGVDEVFPDTLSVRVSPGARGVRLVLALEPGATAR
jgi:protocatechuate 3,4-dioxygenase beta subunit